MTDLSREAAALLREARSDFEPTPAQLDAARQALFAKVGASAPAAGTPWFAAAGGKIGLTVVASVLGVGGWLLVRPAAPPTAAKVVEPAAPAARVASERPIATPLLRGAGEAERDEAAPQSRELPPAKAAARSRGVGEAIAPPARSAGETRPSEAAARVRAAEREGPGSDARGPGETVRGRAAARAIASPARMADEPAAEVASGEQVVVPLEAAAPIQPDLLKREVAFVRNARAAADRGETRVALAILDNYERQFGAGLLFEVQLALRARVLCAAGELARARATLQRLATRAPSSPHLQRACPELKTSR